MFIHFTNEELQLPWNTNYKLCDLKYCNLELNSYSKLNFEKLSKLLAIKADFLPGGSDIRNCLTIDSVARWKFYDNIEKTYK